MAHIRVYDPRGFEFEIGVENLLFILQECTSTKGKGLEGDFVYAFDGKDLILLPCESEDFKVSEVYTKAQDQKVTKADMKEGCVYITKKMEKVMYLGKQNWFEIETYNKEDVLYKYKDVGEKHVFAYVDFEKKKDEWRYRSRYFVESGFTKLSSKVSDVVASNYADIYDDFKKSIEGAGIKSVEVIPSREKITDKNYHYIGQSYTKHLLKIDGDIFLIVFRNKSYSYYGNPGDYTQYEMIATHKVTVEGNSIKYDAFNKVINPSISFGEIKKLEFLEFSGKLHNDKTILIHI
jgi:hypothetical protein